MAAPKMDDPNQSELLTEEIHVTQTPTAKLPRLSDVEKPEPDFRAGQSRILEMIAAGAPLSEILTRLVLLIETQARRPWREGIFSDMLCSVLLLSEDGNHIRHGAAPSLPDDYVKAIDGAPIGPKQGSCGTAMYRGQSVIVSDVLVDPLWEDYRNLALAAGLRACWSTPIMSGRGKVLGSFAMYYREPRTPTGEESGLTEVATRIAGLAIEHQSTRELLARMQAELAEVSQAANTREPVAAITYELSQPLEAIVQNADRCLALLDESKEDSERLREALVNIANDGRHALELIARNARGQNPDSLD